MNREACLRGVPVDVERAKEYQQHLKRLIWDAEQSIPWAKNDDAKILSPKALAEECRKVGIVPPKSLAQDSEECAAWEDKYGEQYPWIGAMRDWRRCNMLLKKVEAFIARTKPDGWKPYGLKYFGASTTGRFSGDSGLNLQNLPRKEMYGVDLRSLIKAPAGYKLAVADLSQIEPRCLAWLSGDSVLLDFIKKSPDLYDAQARAWGLHDGPEQLREHPVKRHLVKGLNLGLGYGMSAAKFSSVSGTPMEEAERLTRLFRSKNPKLLALWKQLERAMKSAAGRGDFTVELPTGRALTYWAVSNVGGALSAITCRMGKMMRSKYWYGLIVENLTQSTAREVFVEKLLNIEALPDVQLLFSVHDEAVCLVRDESADQDLVNIINIMSETPDWMPGLPLAAEGHVVERYGK
jgi:DNA polymerase I-like protein with 3'-5' exonuclease and polymerase domains